MTSFVIPDPRIAGQAAARPGAAVAAVLAARRAVAARAEESARKQVAPDAPADPDRAPSGPRAAAATTTDAVDVRESGAFTAQRLAQETESDPEGRARPSSAAAAYLRTRDSRIQILPSIEALDLRV